MNLYQIAGKHGPIDIRATRSDIYGTFMIERFAYDHEGVTIRAESGQVVIDGGSRYGDTSLYFADCVGNGGAVHAIEANVRDITILRENCSDNPMLGYQTTVTVGALSDHSGDWVSYEADGPLRLLLRPDPWELPLATAPTVSIDDLVTREMITRVDFLKLDVPSPEKALIGARETIQAHRPILAISCPRHEDDIITIQPYLLQLANDYDFFLDHFTFGSRGAVLFARPHSSTPRG
jgi:FkbM family methyltransferase